MNFQQETIVSLIQLISTLVISLIVISSIIRNSTSKIVKAIEKSNRELSAQKKQLNQIVNNLSALKSSTSNSKPAPSEPAEEVEEQILTTEDIKPDTKVYVGNIDYGVTEEDLEHLFSTFGQVELVNIPTNRHSGRTRGFGFVSFSSVEDATKSLELNGTELEGRQLQVNFAKSRQQ